MFEIASRVGRLVESRPEALQTVDDVRAFGDRFRHVVVGIDAPQVVICGDYRDVRVLAPDVAEQLAAMLSAANPRVERSAVLCAADHPTALLQLERIVRMAGNPSRRTFREADELAAWLGEVLTADERQRLSRFLARR